MCKFKAGIGGVKSPKLEGGETSTCLKAPAIDPCLEVPRNGVKHPDFRGEFRPTLAFNTFPVGGIQREFPVIAKGLRTLAENRIGGAELLRNPTSQGHSPWGVPINHWGGKHYILKWF